MLNCWGITLRALAAATCAWVAGIVALLFLTPLWLLCAPFVETCFYLYCYRRK